jgi:UDP-glucose 4-epimerase
MKIAVTGGAGYIGSLLVKTLVYQGHDVVSVDNFVSGDYSRLITLGIQDKAQLLEADIRHKPSLENLETAIKLGIKRFVFCSSAAVYGDPPALPVVESHPLKPKNLYGITKLSGEILVETFNREFDLDTVILRFGNVFGVGLHTNYDTVIPKFIKMALEGKALSVYGDGASSRDFVHIEDIVQAISLSLEKEGISGEIFNVGGETVHIKTIAKPVAFKINEKTGKNIEIEYLPPRAGETKEIGFDLGKIRKKLGYTPKSNVEAGIKQIIDFSTRTE